MGICLLRAFRDCGVRTPEDIAFATFDELMVDDLFTPAVTTVALLDVRLPAILKVRASSRMHSRDGRVRMHSRDGRVRMHSRGGRVRSAGEI